MFYIICALVFLQIPYIFVGHTMGGDREVVVDSTYLLALYCRLVRPAQRIHS